MALKTRAALLQPAHRHPHQPPLPDLSRLVSSITGMPIPRNKAVVGENAFAHESGIHQHGMLKHHPTYEIMRPEDVGLTRTQPRARQAQRPARVPRPRAASSASSSTSSNSTASSRSSRRSPTRRRSCSTATSRRWCCAPRAAHTVRGRWWDSRSARSSAPPPRATVQLLHSDGRASSAAPAATARSMPPSRRSSRPRGSRSSCASSRCTRSPSGEDAQGEAVVYVEYNERSYRGSSVSTNIIEASCKRAARGDQPHRAVAARRARGPARERHQGSAVTAGTNAAAH